MLKRILAIVLVAAAAVTVGSVLAAASGARPQGTAPHVQAGNSHAKARGDLPPMHPADESDLPRRASTPAPMFATMTDWLRLLAHDPFYHSFVGGMPGAWE